MIDLFIGFYTQAFSWGWTHDWKPVLHTRGQLNCLILTNSLIPKMIPFSSTWPRIQSMNWLANQYRYQKLFFFPEPELGQQNSSINKYVNCKMHKTRFIKYNKPENLPQLFHWETFWHISSHFLKLNNLVINKPVKATPAAMYQSRTL